MDGIASVYQWQDAVSRHAMMYLLASGWSLDHTNPAMIPEHCAMQAGKVYVQDRLREQGEHIWALLKQGAYFYVCGDASGMAPAVEQALLSIFASKQVGLSAMPLSISNALSLLCNLEAAMKMALSIYLAAWTVHGKWLCHQPNLPRPCACTFNARSAAMQICQVSERSDVLDQSLREMAPAMAQVIENASSVVRRAA